MKLEAGKYYKTRDGRKVGPMIYDDLIGDGEPWCTDDTERWWSNNGTRNDGALACDDLIAEWNTPVQEVTRREIVPGRYGRVRISENLMVRVNALRTVEELDEAIHILNQVREVMVDA